jgi:hypothetical protein
MKGFKLCSKLTKSTEAEMVAKGNVNKHRNTYSNGTKALEEQKWGRSTARERYGALKQPDMQPADASRPQKLGDANNLQGPGYANNHRNDWIRGAGESAEGMPHYGKIKRRQ